MKSAASRAVVPAVAAVLVFAAFLRTSGIDHDLPYVYDTDELVFLEPSFKHVLRGDLNPHFFLHPGSTLIYLMSATLEAYYQGGRLLGEFGGFDDFDAAYRRDPTAVFLVGRTFSVVFGVLSVLAVYLIGKNLFGPLPGVLAAFLFAVLPLHVKYSRMIRTDALAIALVLFSVSAAVNYLKRGGRCGAWAALLAGLAAATKYTALPAAGTVCLALVLRLGLRRPDGSRAARPASLGAAALVPAGFFLGAPFVLLDFSSAWKGVVAQSGIVTVYYPAIPVVAKLWWYLGSVLPQACGGSLVPWLAAAGIVPVFGQIGWRRASLLLSFPVLYLALILPPPLRVPRYMLYLLPFLALLAAGAVAGASSLLFGRKKIGAWFCGAAVAAAAVFPLRQTRLDNRALAREDVRTVALRWLEENIPPGEGIAYEAFCPVLHQANAGGRPLLDRGYNRIVSRPLEFYEERGYRYVVINRLFQKPVEKNPRRWPQAAQRYRQLDGREKIKTFRQGRMVIEVYRLY